MAPSSTGDLRAQLSELLRDADPAVRQQGIELLHALADPRLLWGPLLRAADLRDADLSGLDLRSADLRDTDLRGASLRGASLRGADLRGADLSKADLRGANLHNVRLDQPENDLRELLPIFQEVSLEMGKVSWPLPAALILAVALDPLVPIQVLLVFAALIAWVLLISGLSVAVLLPIEAIAVRHQQLRSVQWDETTVLPANIYPWLLRHQA